MKPSVAIKTISRLMVEKKPVLLVGSPGVGKTDIAKKVADLIGYEIVIAHPAVDSPVDYKGMPFKISNTEADFIPYGMLLQLINTTKPTIFFLDDIGQAPYAVQAALMQLLLSRSINGKKISDHVVFLAATNEKADKADVSGMLEPVKSRFSTIIRIDINAEDWIEWALNNGMPHDLIAYIKMVPDTLLGFTPTFEIKNSPCPRTVANLGDLHNMNFDEDDRVEIYSGAVGQKLACDFVNFCNVLKKAPLFADILTDPDGCTLPEETDVQMRSIICAMVADRVTAINFDVVLRYIKRMSSEYAQLVVASVVKAKPSLKETETYTKYVRENQGLYK